MPNTRFRDPVTGKYVPLLGGGFSQADGDAWFINLAGDTITGFVESSANPTLASHAVTKAYIDNLMPPGVIASVNSAAAPAGWLICDGTLYSTTTYADLYAVIGTQFGAGSGTFATPNLKARTVVGINTGDGDFATRGQVGGETYHTLSTAEAANASGSVNWHGGGSRTSFYGGSGTLYQVGYIGAYANPQYYHQAATNVGGSNHSFGGGGQAHENRQYSTILTHVIKT